MKTLSEFTEMLSTHSVDYVFKYNEVLETLEDFFNDDIPLYIKENLKNNLYNDYITEFLNSVSVDIIRKELEKNKIEFISVSRYEHSKDLDAKWFIIKAKTDISRLTKFDNILDKFKYNIKQHSKLSKGYMFILEPLFANKANDEIKEKFHNVLYHITSKDNVDNILKNGLRPKYGRNDNKIYSIKKDKEKSDKDHNTKVFMFGSENKDQLISIVNKLYRNISNIAIIKINIPDTVNVYKDTTMEDDYCYYTFTKIPSKFLSKYNINL